MKLDVPDDIVRRAEANGIELRVALAVQLYADNRIDHTDACRLSELSSREFDGELLARGLSVQRYPAGEVLSPGRSAG